MIKYNQLNLFMPHRTDENLSQLARVTLTSFHPGTKNTTTIKTRLTCLRNLGYDFPAYSKMNFQQLSNLLKKLAGEIRSIAEQRCPNVVCEIDLENRRLRKDCAYGIYS